MNVEELFPSLIERLIKKYSEIGKEDILDVIEFSVYMLRILSADLDIDVTEVNNSIWIKKCCYEQLDKMRQGIFSGVKSYSENGYSFTLDSGDVSLALKSLIIPKANAPK